MKLYEDSGRDIVPACYSHQCPIEFTATDDAATEFIEKFQVGAALARITEWPESRRKIIKELKLEDDPMFWLQLEYFERKWIEMHQHQAEEDKKRFKPL